MYNLCFLISLKKEKDCSNVNQTVKPSVTDLLLQIYFFMEFFQLKNIKSTADLPVSYRFSADPDLAMLAFCSSRVSKALL